jgi:uncharacterized membrane protein
VTPPADLPPPAHAKPSAGVWIAIAIVLIGYAGLSHYSNSRPDSKGLAASLSVGPVLLIGGFFLWRWARPVIALLITAALGASLYHYWGFIENNYEWADLVQQCGAYALVAMSFARTAFRGHVPLCTQLAVKLHGSLSPIEESYTRKATVAWAVFYVAMAVAIAVLFFTVSQENWSLFVNFATFGLTAVACLVDAAVRHAVLPRRPGGGILALLRQAFIG